MMAILYHKFELFSQIFFVKLFVRSGKVSTLIMYVVKLVYVLDA
jgi:hypothetical protein